MFQIFNSIFWVQFYSSGASIIIGFHYHHIMPDFCEMNSVLRVFFRVLLSGKYFLDFLLVAKYFLGRSEIPNSADACL